MLLRHDTNTLLIQVKREKTAKPEYQNEMLVIALDETYSQKLG
jgi:hypothetical protein